MSKHLQALTFALAMACLASRQADSAITAQEAMQLKSRLTPLGAERAGNADRSIPAWTGTAPSPGALASERPLFAITAANYQAYADRLPEGQKALFARYPDYRMDIYPSHRTAVAPAQVYASVFANATRARRCTRHRKGDRGGSRRNSVSDPV